MKFLIHSNAPTAATGYGVQAALLADRLAGDGHEVAVSCTWGHQTGITTWRSPGGHSIRLYPMSAFHAGGLDILPGHADHWFEGDPKAGWIITLVDVHAIASPLLAGFQVLAWTPVDHDPAPPYIARFLETTKATPVAMSRFGARALADAGIKAAGVPLAVNANAYRPTWELNGRSSREVFGLDPAQFVVGMVAMNKDPNDRKGFGEAFQAFAEFHRSHPEALLYVHTEQHGLAGGVSLPKMAKACGIPEHAIRFAPQWAYRIQLGDREMAALYTSFDVLLAPSAGEGFCVPLIEAQACGVPVIASNFTAQPELVGEGVMVSGQRVWDDASESFYQRPNVAEIVQALEVIHQGLQLDAPDGVISTNAREFAMQYDADHVFATYWRPLIAALEPAPREPMTDVAVLVPAMRARFVEPLVRSFNESNDGTANLYLIVDPDNADLMAAAKEAGATYLVSDRGSTFACKLNSGYRQTTESWVGCFGEDVEFTPGWLAEVRALSDRFDVIGTNDAHDGEVRNVRVASGEHADHFLVRRSYVDEQGACLDGPGYLAPEAYHHYFTDVEIIEVAKVRRVWSPCLTARVIHHQPRYEGRPEEWDADPVYAKGGEFAKDDARAFHRRIAKAAA